jgi:hypothetical protein
LDEGEGKGCEGQCQSMRGTLLFAVATLALAVLKVQSSHAKVSVPVVAGESYPFAPHYRSGATILNCCAVPGACHLPSVISRSSATGVLQCRLLTMLLILLLHAKGVKLLVSPLQLNRLNLPSCGALEFVLESIFVVGGYRRAR